MFWKSFEQQLPDLSFLCIRQLPLRLTRRLGQFSYHVTSSIHIRGIQPSWEDQMSLTL